MYTITKTIKGKQYRYLQRSYREGGKVRTQSIYLGPIGAVRRVAKRAADFVRAQQLDAHERADLAAQRAAEKNERQQREQFGETAAERTARERQETLDRLHDAYGLRMPDANPVPVEAPTAPPPDAGADNEPASSGSESQ